MKRFLALLVTGLLFLAVGIFIGTRGASVVHAQGGIPKAWGPCKGATATGQLIFEDSSGTVRLVSTEGSLVAQINRSN